MKISVSVSLNNNNNYFADEAARHNKQKEVANDEKPPKREKVSTLTLGLGQRDSWAPGTTKKQMQNLSKKLTKRHKKHQQERKRRSKLVRQQKCEEEDELEGEGEEPKEEEPEPTTSKTEAEDEEEEPQLVVNREKGREGSQAKSAEEGASDEEVEESRNSSDNSGRRPAAKRIKLANPVLSPPPLPAIPITVPSQKAKKAVNFGNVEMFSFGWAQGCDTVPSSGLISLGMEPKHHAKHIFKLEEYARYRRAKNKLKMASWQAVAAQHCASSSNNSSTASSSKKRRMAREKAKKKFADKALEQSTSSSSGEEEGEEEQEEEGPEQQQFDHFHVMEPLRRALLEQSGVNIEEDVADDTQKVQITRNRCGCRCPGGKCLPSKCECAREGIQCQVDSLDDSDPHKSFPCWCSAKQCKNPEGRVELDSLRIRNHVHQTLMRLKAAQKMGLDDSGQTHSPQHIFFRDEEEGGEKEKGGRQPRKTEVAEFTGTTNKQEVPGSPNVTIRKKNAKIGKEPEIKQQGQADPDPTTPLFPKFPSLLDGSNKKKKRKN